MEVHITRDIEISELTELYREPGWLYKEDGVEEGEDVVAAIVQKTYAYAIATEDG